MDVIELLRACVRRWYVLLPVFAVFAVAAVGLFDASRPAYRVSASVTVVPSPGLSAARDITAPEGVTPDTNPFGSPVVLAVLVSRNLGLAEVSSQLPTGSALVAEWDGRRPTLISLETTSGDAAGAQQAMATAEAATRRLLEQLQAERGVPSEITFQAVGGEGLDFPVRITPDRQRMTIVTLAAGVLTAITLSTVLDVGLRRREAVRAELSSRPRATETVDA
ncbi:hypothetical protein [Modestobacter sp. Leaf380]|uniref:hypothetical protein n=1 Tax=Modestobacter sp. Leaf380 TaxID=1736356 RepID=UPI0007011D30|nr:hypothetical protein [Modestobacter sp. Leaf380]KQS68840.1 hypothetical protein ASG41_08005 [Modestobacter sp. Leaf380]